MGNTNCSLHDVPSAKDHLNEIRNHPLNLTIIITCTLITAILVILLVESAWFLQTKVRPSTVANHRITTWWMIAILPVMSCVVLPGLYSPVTATFCNLIASICYSFTMFKFLILVVNYYGGYHRMIIRFSAEQIHFPLASTPIACCCKCLPKKRLTRDSFTWLKIAVLQVAILKPISMFIGVIFWLDGVYLTNRLEDDEPFFFINIFMIFSSVIAMMAINMLCIASIPHLKKYNIGIKFGFIKLGIMFSNIQPALLSLFMRFRVLGCTLPYTNTIRANVLQCVLLIVESGITFPFIRKYYRCSKGNVVGIVPMVHPDIVGMPLGSRRAKLHPMPPITSDYKRPSVPTIFEEFNEEIDTDSCQITIEETLPNSAGGRPLSERFVIFSNGRRHTIA